MGGISKRMGGWVWSQWSSWAEGSISRVVLAPKQFWHTSGNGSVLHPSQLSTCTAQLSVSQQLLGWRKIRKRPLPLFEAVPSEFPPRFVTCFFFLTQVAKMVPSFSLPPLEGRDFFKFVDPGGRGGGVRLRWNPRFSSIFCVKC